MKQKIILSKESMIQLVEWFCSGNTGVSSITIVATILGLNVKYSSIPHDPSDFCRCLKLLKAVPELKAYLHLMSDASVEWQELIKHWDEIEESLMSEVPDCLDGGNGLASKTFKLMQKYRSVK